MEGLERRISVRLLVLCLLSLWIPRMAAAGVAEEELIRFSLWAPLEAYPGSGERVDVNAPFAYPISRLKETVPFFIEGMVCGWAFVYRPSDKLRDVAEEFEFVPLREYPDMMARIRYTEPWVEGNRLNCWVEFHCPSHLTSWRRMWKSLDRKRVAGKGMGLLTDGFDGIHQGASQALKAAVRSYAQSVTKNKPREIRGEVLLAGAPKIGVKSGRYVVDLDFFLNVSRIVDYTIY